MAAKTDAGKDVEKIKDAVSDDKKSKKSDKDEEEKELKLTDLPGIGPAVSAKLEAAGIYDLMSVAVMTPPAMSEASGVSPAVARKAIQAARSMLKLGFMEGTEYAKKRESVNHITTGSKNFDTLLGGKGLESRAITEVFGAFGSGKCVSKDTFVSYFNDARMHVEPIEMTYEKYKKDNELAFDEGTAVPVSTVKVLAWNKGKFDVVKASYLYKERVRQLYSVRTKRGRVLKVTGNHKVLSFDKGVRWKRISDIKKGDLIASPQLLDLTTEHAYDEDDAYFLGLFVAEGTSNPFSLSIGSCEIKNWICSYINRRFGYVPTVRIDNRREKPVYCILLRNNTRVMMEGLDKCNTATKFIPEPVFLSSPNVVSSFLGGYFDGDATVSENLSVTTKSPTLATQLSYLLLRLGIGSSLGERAYEKYGSFKVLSISGEDREALKDLKFKLKKFDAKLKNSAYGFPREIVSFIADMYKTGIGGNRGRLRKSVGKKNTPATIYSNLTRRSSSKSVGRMTLNSIENLFSEQRDIFVEIIKKLEKSFSSEILREIYPLLPFAFNNLAEDMGLKKKSVQNYYSRRIPKNKLELLKNLIINELKTRVDVLCLAQEVISEIKMFKWDIVESARLFDYNDYVYDFVVPEGHSFLGGNLPTMMHNTQVGSTLAVNVQLPVERGGANGKCVFIDTEGTFRPSRIRQIAEGLGANPEKVLKNILVARAFNSDHQILLLDRVSEMIKEGEPIKLMIIDSLTAHFRAEYSGRGQLADRQQKLNRYIHNLMKLAETHNLAVLVTNQVMANPAQLFGDPTTAIGGHIVGHASTYRIYLRRGKKDSRVAKLVDSPNLPDTECVFFVDSAGVVDEKT